MAIPTWKLILEKALEQLNQGGKDGTEAEWLSFFDMVVPVDVHLLQKGLTAFGAGLLEQKGAPKQTLDERILFEFGRGVLKGIQKLEQNRATRQRQRDRIAQLPPAPSVAKLRKLSPEDFEYWTAAYFERFGFKKVTVTTFSADFGVDVHMTCPNGKKAVVQCKNKVRSSKPVGSPVVQQTYGAMKLLDAEMCYVATTGIFSEKAKELDKRADIALLDGAFLVSGQRPSGSRKRRVIGSL